MKSETEKNSETQELKVRPAFDMYSDEEDEECEFVEVPEVASPPFSTIVQKETPSSSVSNTFNQQSGLQNQTHIPQFNTKFPISQPPPTTSKQKTYISTQEIKRPTMLDFEEVNNQACLGLQDLSLFERRKNEYNFHYNNLPSYRQCINFRASYKNTHFKNI